MKMIENLRELKDQINKSDIDASKIRDLMLEFLTKHVKGLKIDNYIGDYPTFMEPVILGDDVKIGDDVLIGPNVYIGKNSDIGDYVEISNSIILDDVKIGENIKLDRCIIARESKLNFDNFSKKDCILKGIADSKEEITIISF